MIEVDFKHASKQTRERAFEKGLIRTRAQETATMGMLDGSWVLLKTIDYGVSVVQDGTLAQAIKRLQGIQAQYKFLGGPENITITSGERYEWGESVRFTNVSGWIEMDLGLVSTFKAYRKIVLDETRVAQGQTASALKEKASKLDQEADRLRREAERLAAGERRLNA